MPYKDKDKQREYQRVWSVQRNLTVKQKAVDMLGGMCNRCGIDDLRVLQFDHIVPILRDKDTASSSTIIAQRIVNGKYDVKLFQVLCANCHCIKTYEEDRPKFRRSGRKISASSQMV